MSGHSKWATTKHQKAVVDARRAKLFAKLIKNIEVAARIGGGDVAGNPTLYDAIQKAKKTSVPKDNIDRAVKRGSGAEGGGADYETLMYEAYGPAGVALLIECLTDNRNRSASEVRVAVTRNGGTMADAGSTAADVQPQGCGDRGQGAGGPDADRGRRAGGDPGRRSGGGQRPRRRLRDHQRPGRHRSGAHRRPGRPVWTTTRPRCRSSPSSPRRSMPPTAEKLMKIIEALEDSDDVQNVYANFDASDEVLASLG